MKKNNILRFTIFISLFVFGCNLLGNRKTPSSTSEPVDPSAVPTLSQNPPQTKEGESELSEETNNLPQLPQNAPIPTEVQDLIFSIENINLVPPDDIIQELAYFGGFGGMSGGWDRCTADFKTPSFLDTTDEVEVMEAASFLICGISIGELVNIQVKLPDNSVLNFSETSSTTNWSKIFGYVSFEFIPNYRDLKGRYYFTFTGNGWSLDQFVNVHDPYTPRLYLVSNELIFYKFQPNERIQLLAYESGSQTKLSKLLGWENYQVDLNGKLAIKTNITGNFVAIGETSGEVFHYQPGESFESSFWWFVDSVSCTGAPPTRGINPLENAEVLTDDLIMFDALGTSSGAIIPKGTVLILGSNPICHEEAWWFFASCMDFKVCQGYIKEGDFDRAYIENTPKIPALLVPFPYISQLEPFR